MFTYLLERPYLFSQEVRVALLRGGYVERLEVPIRVIAADRHIDLPLMPKENGLHFSRGITILDFDGARR